MKRLSVTVASATMRWYSFKNLKEMAKQMQSPGLQDSDISACWQDPVGDWVKEPSTPVVKDMGNTEALSVRISVERSALRTPRP